MLPLISSCFEKSYIKYVILLIIVNYVLFLGLVNRKQNDGDELMDPQFNNRLKIMNDYRIFYHKQFCECKIDGIIGVEKSINQEYKVTILNNTIGSRTLLYSLKEENLANLSLTCDSYRNLRRGPGQKVISLSFVKNDQVNFNNLKLLAQTVKKLYPDWVIRVYHNGSLSSDEICNLECADDEQMRFMHNMDFCDISNSLIGVANSKLVNVRPSLWRLLPIGDDFVDVFLAGEIDETFIERNSDYSNWRLSIENIEKLKGFFNIRDRLLAKNIFHKLGDIS